MSSLDIFANFNCLDELTQVIYQSIDRFVVLSSVLGDQWHIHLGLSGEEGRWWHGHWSKDDILKLVGQNPSDILLEAFAEKLAQTFVGGELYIGNWSPEKDAKIDLTLGPTSKRPMHVHLVEMDAHEAAAHATKIFLDIALQAQSRKCHLHPGIDMLVPSYDARDAGTRPVERSNDKKREEASISVKSPKRPSASSAKPDAQVEIENLKLQLEKEKNKKRLGSVEKSAATAPRPLKGASLANPNKKARKYQAIEFASDEE